MIADRYQTVPVIARRLGWSPGKLYRLVEADEVKHTNLGSLWVELESVYATTDDPDKMRTIYEAEEKKEEKERRRASSSGKRKGKSR
jgi:hypothetical protein